MQTQTLASPKRMTQSMLLFDDLQKELVKLNLARRYKSDAYQLAGLLCEDYSKARGAAPSFEDPSLEPYKLRMETALHLAEQFEWQYMALKVDVGELWDECKEVLGVRS